ncbi:MAG: hypothetical protein ACXVHV_04490 [Methanobacterium sp.]
MSIEPLKSRVITDRESEKIRDENRNLKEIIQKQQEKLNRVKTERSNKMI